VLSRWTRLREQRVNRRTHVQTSAAAAAAAAGGVV